MKHINLEQLANGAFSEQINRELERVTQNIQDPNTDAKATRKVVVTITLKPNEQRNIVTTGVDAKSTLAPSLGAVTVFSMGRDLKTGEVEAIEVGNQLPGQMSFDDVDEASDQEVLEKKFNPDTGEIYERPVGNNVVDLRARQA